MLIDAHAHLDQYGDELDAVLEEIRQHRIFTISTSMDLPSYARNLQIGDMCDLVLPTFGVHPLNAPEYADCLGDLREATERSPMLGEIGLDYYYVSDVSQYPAQRRIFESFLAAAREQGKIVNLHTKGAEQAVLRLLDRYDIERAIVHWYSGPLDVFRQLTARGTYFTVGVEVLHSKHIQTIARELPARQLLTETDNPSAHEWLTGKPGMPLLVNEVIQALARLREATTEDIIQTVEANFARLIRDDPWIPRTHLHGLGRTSR